MNYSTICNHNRVERINDNFIKCLQCNETIINQLMSPTNKSTYDFVRENKSFMRNTSKNPYNVVELTPQNHQEVFMDQHGINKVIVSRQGLSDGTYPVTINNVKYYLTKPEIEKVLTGIGAIRIKN